MLTILLYVLFGKRGEFLDFAGGYGVFVRIMRDVGMDFYWDDKHTRNLFSVGFERRPDTTYDAVTLFEAFEHFVDPMSEIRALLMLSDTLIFSTQLYPDAHPRPGEWWYYGLEHGQHISFYSKATLEYIASESGTFYSSTGSLHILSRQRVPRWKLFASRLSRVGLHAIIGCKLKSKTLDDYKHMIEMDR